MATEPKREISTNQRIWNQKAADMVEMIAEMDDHKKAWDTVEKGARKRPDIQR